MSESKSVVVVKTDPTGQWPKSVSEPMTQEQASAEVRASEDRAYIAPMYLARGVQSGIDRRTK